MEILSAPFLTARAWLAAFVVATLASRIGFAQQSPRISLGYGIDTSSARVWGDFRWRDPVPAIVDAWRSYLITAATNDTGRMASAWSSAERAQWPDFDLPRVFAWLSGDATILDVRPIRPGDSTEYIVRTLFANVSKADSAERGIARPIAIARVVARREQGRWMFANVLPRETRDWQRVQVGPITYVVEPGFPFRRARADAAVRFADSLANAFKVPRLSSLSYYVTSTPDVMNRIIGLDWAITYGGNGGGYAQYRNRQIFSGDPKVGEEYRHELAHFVLGGLSPAGGSHPFIVEGVATWLGGTLGMSAVETRRAFAMFLRANPAITLDAAMASADGDRGFRPGGAVICAMVFERGGTDAIRRLLSFGRSGEPRELLQQLLGMSWADVNTAWRARALKD